MAAKLDPNVRRVEVKASITEDLHGRLTAECGHCGCHLSGFIAIAIANEIAARKRIRRDTANHAVLVGQLSLDEGKPAEMGTEHKRSTREPGYWQDTANSQEDTAFVRGDLGGR